MNPTLEHAVGAISYFCSDYRTTAHASRALARGIRKASPAFPEGADFYRPQIEHMLSREFDMSMLSGRNETFTSAAWREILGTVLRELGEAEAGGSETVAGGRPLRSSALGIASNAKLAGILSGLMWLFSGFLALTACSDPTAVYPAVLFGAIAAALCFMSFRAQVAGRGRAIEIDMTRRTVTFTRWVRPTAFWLRPDSDPLECSLEDILAVHDLTQGADGILIVVTRKGTVVYYGPMSGWTEVRGLLIDAAKDTDGSGPFAARPFAMALAGLILFGVLFLALVWFLVR